jgi:hypothetical protein
MNVDVRRATLEDVQRNQENLIHGRTGIDSLIETNGFINKEDRKTYFKWLAFSLLGKGLKYTVWLRYQGNEYNLGNVSMFSRQMAYYPETMDHCVTIVLKGERKQIKISLLWEALRTALFEPMDEALDDAIHISKEREIIRPGKGASMDDVRKG